MKTTLSFKPKQSVKKLLLALNTRSRDVIIKRYGLGKNPSRMTLDAIGKTYNITRERVRQIENHAISIIRKSKNYTEEKPAFDELEKLIHSLGGIIVERDLLDHVSKDKSTQSQIDFLLVIGQQFKIIKEDEDYKRLMMLTPHLFLNKMLTCSFYEYTDKDIPFHIVHNIVRDYENNTTNKCF